MTNAFDKIAAGLADAIAYAEGDTARGQVATIDVAAIRRATGMTQADFAAAFGLTLGALRDWEQGRRQPDTGSITLLRMIAADAAGVRAILVKAA